MPLFLYDRNIGGAILTNKYSFIKHSVSNSVHNNVCYNFGRKKCVIYVCICVVGIMQIHILENNYNGISSKIPEELTIKALITSNASEKEYKYTYTVTVSEINGEKLEKGIQLMLNIKKNKIKKMHQSLVIL